jgi:hypothetical protein
MTRFWQASAVAIVAASVSIWGDTPAVGGAISLNGVIGPAGTDAAAVQGAGRPVNQTGYASNAGATSLTTQGSGGPAFDFNAGFPDGNDRATGSSAGAGHVIADRKYNSEAASPMILDMDNDAVFSDEVDSAPSDPDTFHFGFGMHADTFITFDLAVIRSQYALPAHSEFDLTGQVGLANVNLGYRTGAAILLDGNLLAVYDFDGRTASYHGVDSLNLSIPGDGRYLTFIGLSGLDGTNGWDHLGFRNVTLTPVPEPGSAALLLAALAPSAFFCARRRRLRTRQRRTP